MGGRQQHGWTRPETRRAGVPPRRSAGRAGPAGLSRRFGTARLGTVGSQGRTAEASMSFRAARAMWDAEIPAAPRHSAGVPEPGRLVTARRATGTGLPDLTLQLGRAALPQAVDVDDHGQIRQAVERGPVQGLPETRQHGSRMALQPTADPPIAGEKLLLRHDARSPEHRVEQRRRVPLGEHQTVVGRIVRVLPVIAQVPSLQHRHQVGGRHAGRRMPGPGSRTGAHGVHPQLLSELEHHLHIAEPVDDRAVGDMSIGHGCPPEVHGSVRPTPRSSFESAQNQLPGRRAGHAPIPRVAQA